MSLLSSFNATVLTPGPDCRGPITTRPAADEEGYILLVRQPGIEHFHALRRCRAVLCEEGGVNNHPAVLCRIWGKPMLAVERATQQFGNGEMVTLAPAHGKVYRGLIPTPGHDHDHPQIDLALENSLQFQLSIVDDGDIRRTNRLGVAQRVRQFFVREELLWVKHDLEPFTFLRQHSPRTASAFLAEQLKHCIGALRQGQSVNFRSLDMRSDECPVPNALGVESNPHLGNHGIRRTLREGGPFLAVEAQALALLTRAECQKVVFSLPFVTEEEEVLEAERLLRQFCPHRVRLGVFIETPAAVTELPAILANADIGLVSIGTKDLTQTILACDRGNSAVRHLYSARKRPVLHAIRSALAACDAYGTPVILFASPDELAFFHERLPSLQCFSMCCGEFIQAFTP
jgi:signal transduction protein with GAF and PtsI domain